MIYITIASIVALIVLPVVFAGIIRSLIRQHARERNLMLDKIMHLAGRTWTPPPAGEPAVAEPDDFGRYVYTPSQLLDDED